MRINQARTDPNKYKRGGSIRGDYKFQRGTKVTMGKDADIELSDENSRLQQRDDTDNYLCFKTDETFVSKNLVVAGELDADSIHTHAHTVDGNLTVTGALTAHSTQTQSLTTLTAQTQTIDVTTALTAVDGTFSNNLTVTEDLTTKDLLAVDGTISNILTVEEVHATGMHSETLDVSIGADIYAMVVHEDAIVGGHFEVDGSALFKGSADIPILNSSDFTTNAAPVNYQVDCQTIVTTGQATLQEALVKTTLDVEGDTTLQNVTAQSLTVPTLNLTDLTTTNLHTTNLYATELKSNMIFNTNIHGAGTITISTGPLDHEVYIGYDKIELTDHNPTHAGHIKLDVSTGEIECNGGLRCYNDNAATNLVNPKGILTDFVQTQAHRSDFGMNAVGESLTASGAIKALAFRIPSTTGLPDFGGILPTHSYHQISMVTRSMYADHFYAQDTGESSVHIDMENDDIDLNVNSENIVNVGDMGTNFYKDVSFEHADKVVFTGLTAADIIGWPLADNYLHNAMDTDIGIEVFLDAGHTALGTVEANQLVGTEGLFTKATFGLGGAGIIDFKDVEKLDFTGLTEAQILGWPAAFQGLENADDVVGGIEVYTDATKQHVGRLGAAEVVAGSLSVQDAEFGLSGAGVVNFTDVEKLVFTGLSMQKIVGWPMGLQGLQNAGDVTGGVEIFTNSNHDSLGRIGSAQLACVELYAKDALFGVQGSGGTVDFRDVTELNFTSLTTANFTNWPWQVSTLRNMSDDGQGIKVYTDPAHTTQGTMHAAIVNCTDVVASGDVQTDSLHAGDATFTKTLDFTGADLMVFTGLTAADIVDWPLDKPEGLENIEDTATGVQVDGTMDATIVRADFIEPHTAQVLRINGFEMVRVADQLNVLGDSVLQKTFVSDTLHCSADANFLGPVTFDASVTGYTIEAQQLNANNSQNPAYTPHQIHLTYGTPVQPEDAFMKCYLGPTDNYQTMSLGHDGYFIGNGFAFREDRKTRLYRTSVSANGQTEDMMALYVDQNWVYTMASDRAVFDVEVQAPNVKSSGSFSHCHICEPEDQATDWASLVGRLIESTGDCAVRDDAGALIQDFKLVPSLSHAMCSARVAETSCLGVLNSVELVADNEILHPHGIMLRHRVAEPDGHKVLRVCGSGDCFVWTVQPVNAETILTPSIISGLFTKYVNGVEQSEKVVLTCHDDFSFQMMINLPTLASRLSALEEAFNTLTNQVT